MKYKSCYLLEHGISIEDDSIFSCCVINGRKLGKPEIIKEFKGEKIDWETILEIKRKHREEQRKGVISACEGCIHLKEMDWDDEDYISYINFNHWSLCNSDCIYCNTHQNHNQKIKSLLPSLKELIKMNKFRNDGEITFQGGEPTVLPGFSDILKLFIDNNQYGIRLHSSGILYNETIKEGLEKNIVTLVTSIDSGTDKTYKIIKRVDRASQVWNNIKKYRDGLDDSLAHLVKLKYLIIPNVNDTLEEVQAFLNRVKANDIRSIIVDIESAYAQSKSYNVDAYIYYLQDYIENFANNNGISFALYDFAMYAEQKRTIKKLVNLEENEFIKLFEETKKKSFSNDERDNSESQLEKGNPMKYKSCHLLEHGISIDVNSIRACCLLHDEYKGKPVILDEFKDGKIDWDEVFYTKRQQRQQQREQTLPECEGCRLLREADWDCEDYIAYINIDHWRHCNSKCIYCERQQEPVPHKNNALPAIKELIKRGMFENSGEVTFEGGEPTVLKEFDALLKLFIKERTRIRIHSSGIKYSRMVSDGLKKGLISIVISPDAGNEETYLKIKRVKKFKDVWKHIEKYRNAASKANPNAVKVKYIITPAYNDNLEDIDAFFNMIEKTKVSSVILDIDFTYGLKNKDNVSPHVYLLIDYFEHLAKEKNLEFGFYDSALYAENQRKCEKITEFDREQLQELLKQQKEANKDKNLDYHALFNH